MMLLDKPAVEEALARMNAQRRPEHAIRLLAYEAPGKFTLSFPDRPMPEGECIDQDFSAIQFLLLDAKGISTDLRGGREADGRYVIDYEAIDWDA